MKRKKILLTVAIISAFFVAACASDGQNPKDEMANAMQGENSPGEENVLINVDAQEHTGGADETTEPSEGGAKIIEEYDDTAYTTVYTIQQPDGVNVTIEQVKTIEVNSGVPGSFTCTFRIADAQTDEKIQLLTVESYLRNPLAETAEPFADLNFDGYADITFTTYHAQNDNTDTYLWHPDTGSFEQFESFTGVAGTARNAAMKQISERMRGSASTGLDTMYQFVTPYQLEKVWVVDYTYDRSDTETEGDARFQIDRYPEGEREKFIDDIFLCDEDYANTGYYWKIYGSQITHTIPIEGGTIYYTYYIKRPELDPEGVRHHYTFLVTDDHHLAAWAETENKKEVSDAVLQEAGVGTTQKKTPGITDATEENAVIKLTYGDGTSELLQLQKTNELIE